MCNFIFDESIPGGLADYEDAMKDGFPIAILKTQNPNLHVSLGCSDVPYRAAIIRATGEAFGSAIHRFYRFVVSYRGANFNIVPPILKEFRPCVFDAIGELRDREIVCSNDGEFDSYPELTQEETSLVKAFPNGWGTADYKLYHKHPSYNHREMRRLQWRTSTVAGAELYIHPDEDRPLTNGELQFLQYDTHIEWLQQLIDLFLQNHWGEQDWESRYDICSEQWLGTNCPGKILKEYDLTLYRPNFYQWRLGE